MSQNLLRWASVDFWLENVLVILKLPFLTFLFLQVLQLLSCLLHKQSWRMSGGNRKKWLLLSWETFLTIDVRSKSTFRHFLLFLFSFLDHQLLLVKFFKIVQFSKSLRSSSCSVRRLFFLFASLLIYYFAWLTFLLKNLTRRSFFNCRMSQMTSIGNYPFTLLIQNWLKGAFLIHFIKGLLLLFRRNLDHSVSSLVVVQMLEVLK